MPNDKQPTFECTVNLCGTPNYPEVEESSEGILLAANSRECAVIVLMDQQHLRQLVRDAAALCGFRIAPRHEEPCERCRDKGTVRVEGYDQGRRTVKYQRGPVCLPATFGGVDGDPFADPASIHTGNSGITGPACQVDPCESPTVIVPASVLQCVNDQGGEGGGHR
jgi:hypothetical protein